ncbi:cytosine permease [Nonomuraea sp. JJY05]|uniref:cytosine permease n=1 Tax=Nonomuraea sp. JJY05 TaxID=3350255 RepID=UPI00373E83B4
MLALVTAGISGPVAYATIIGDYTRYLSPRRHSAAGIMWSSAAGLFCGLLAPTLFGAFVAISTRAKGAYLESVARAATAWYLPLLLFAGVAGCLGAAGVPLYNMGLELHGLFPRTSRTAGAAAATAITLGLVFLGRFTVGVEEAVTGFVVVLTGGLDVGYLLSALVSACVYLLLGTGHVTGEPIPDWRQTYLWPAATR